MDNNAKTDYEILTDFLRLTTGTEKIDDISIRKYIKYYCDIHIDHVIQNFLPAKMFNDITGGRDWSITKNMILSEVLENLQTSHKHLTVGEFYKDIFLMTAPFGLDESTLPKIRPSEANKTLVSQLCNIQVATKYFGGNTPKKTTNIFPINWLMSTIFMCALIAILYPTTHYQISGPLDANALKFIGFLISVLLASVSMVIAWKRNIKHKKLVYLDAFLGGWFVGGPLWLISALLLAILEPKAK